MHPSVYVNYDWLKLGLQAWTDMYVWWFLSADLVLRRCGHFRVLNHRAGGRRTAPTDCIREQPVAPTEIKQANKRVGCLALTQPFALLQRSVFLRIPIDERILELVGSQSDPIFPQFLGELAHLHKGIHPR